MKTIKIISALLIAVSLTACQKTKEDTPITTENVQDILSDVEAPHPEEYASIEFESNDKQIIFQRGGNTVVYKRDGDTITGFSTYIDYDTPAKANDALQALQERNDSSVEKAEVNGKYLVITYSEKTYEGLTVDDIVDSYESVANYSYARMDDNAEATSSPEASAETTEGTEGSEGTEATPVPDQTEVIPPDMPQNN